MKCGNRLPLSARGRVRGSCWSSGIPSATRPLPLPGFLRQRAQGLVAVRARSPLAGVCLFQDGQRRRLSGLCRKSGTGRGKRSGHPLSRTGSPVASDEKRSSHAGTGSARQPPDGLVELREGSRVAGADQVRAAGCGCPVCANREILPRGKRSGHAVSPARCPVAPHQNRGISPNSVASGSGRRVWWLCEKGHAWQASVFSRTSGGTGCPYCAGRRVIAGENDLSSLLPAIAAQWHPTNNGALTPEQVAPSSNRKVWWRCERGHDYQATIAARTRSGSGCPYCAGRKVLQGFNDLATLAPDIARQWHPTGNGALTPQMVTVGSHRKVWWECSQGHVWKAVIYSRAGAAKCGCPVCAGRTGKKRLTRYRAVVAKEVIGV